MPISVSRDTAAETLIYCEILYRWSWPEFHIMLQKLRRLTESDIQPVDVIIDMRYGLRTPTLTGIMPSKETHSSGKIRTVAVVGPLHHTHLVPHVLRESGGIGELVYLTNSLSKARKIISGAAAGAV